MDYFPIITLIILGVALISGVIIYVRKKGALIDNDAISTKKPSATISGALAAESIQSDLVVIPVELLPVTTQIKENSLFEITDSTVIARISQTIPAVVDVAARTFVTSAANTAIKSANTAADLAVKNANKVFQNGDIYRAIIPGSATLAKSTQMEGAVRGIYRGANGIKGHANLVKVKAPGLTKVGSTTMSKASTMASGVANVMNVASLVVGQYYMSEISSKLETMTKSIDKISDFQDREFKSRILSVINLVGEISQFSSEVIEDDEQRNRKLATIDNLKATATELLGQVNITIIDITKKSPNPDYKDYQAKVDEFSILVEYQNVLVAVLGEISKLAYLLGKGTISTKMSYAVFEKYLEQSVQTRNQPVHWHDMQIKALQIDLDRERISKAGFEAVFSALPGLIDAKHKYKGLKQGFVQGISSQTKAMPESSEKPKQVYSEDIEIIIKDGKFYYLHEFV